MNNFFEKEQLNKIQMDEFKRTHAVIAVNKKAGPTSHDIVNIVRHKLRTRKVGHAGALDPFAAGVLLILVGDYTKLSDKFVFGDKEYKGTVLLGVRTDTQDPEGRILEVSDKKLAEKRSERENGYNLKNFIEKKLSLISKGYNQRVPVFSSIKVKGQKLRKLAHSAEKIEIKDDTAIFSFSGDVEKLVRLPRRAVKFSRFDIMNISDIKVSELDKNFASKLKKKAPGISDLQLIEIVVGCTKGTYIRQLAEDMGSILGFPSMLLKLERTKVRDINLSDCIDVKEIPQL